MGYWAVLPYEAVRHLPHLRLAPAGVVPQRARRPRPIMDYSYNSINQHSFPLQPAHAMQFGATLQRILQRLVYCNPCHGPPLLAKVDLADGYYRVPLAATASQQLAVLIPNDAPGPSPPLVAFPLTLPMGWAHSPPYFCAFTETITDMTNAKVVEAPARLPHRLLHTSQDHITPQATTFHDTAVVLGSHKTPPLQYADVYIDDFLAVTQRPFHQHTLNTLLHNIDTVFTNVDPSRRDVISLSKIANGDATLSTTKRILGWDIDTHRMTLSLPQHRLDALNTLLLSTLNKKRTSRKKWHVLLGTLRSTTPALYGAAHLFSILQYALTDTATNRIRLTPLIKAVLRDWIHLASHIHHNPAPLHTLVPTKPTIVAATDASLLGMGGFWLPLQQPARHFLWRAPFPQAVQQTVLTHDNPAGPTTNSALELAAVVTGSTLAALSSPDTCPNILVATDNTPACAWIKKGSTTSKSAPAYILHHLAQLRRHCPFMVDTCYTPGATNNIADCCSRLFHLTDENFLSYMNATYPVKPSWTLVHPPNEMLSSMNSVLLNKFPSLASMQAGLPPQSALGLFGKPSAETCIATPSSPHYTTPSPSCKYSPTATEQVPWLPAALKYALAQWRTPYEPWVRRSPHWDVPIHASRHLVN
jgi:hypothetical protein